MMNRLVPAAALLLVALGCQENKPRYSAKVGVITALTGTQAAFGTAHNRGYDLALEEINAAGGVLGKPLEVIKYDDQSKADVAAQGASKLIDQERVPVVLGSYSSESTLAIIPAMTRRQIPLLIPTAVADNVIQTGSPWVFRLCAGATDYAAAMLAFLKDAGTPKSLAIVYENTNFGQANAASMKKAATEAGIPIVSEEAYSAGSPSYTAMLQKVKEKEPEAIYFASYLLDATSLMHQARQVELSPKYFTAAGTGFSAAEFPTEDKGAGKDAEYTFSVSQWMPQATSWPGTQELDAKFVQRYGAHPAYHVVQAYASLKVVAAAINKAGKWDPVAIRDAIKATELMTPFGPIKFGQNGQNQHPLLITQVQSGKYQIVYPKDVATTQPILPTPKWSERR